MQVPEFQENPSWMAEFDELRKEVEMLAVFQKWNLMKKLKT
jgi:hypothetical protein